jgi:hypothetical protein
MRWTEHVSDAGGRALLLGRETPPRPALEHGVDPPRRVERCTCCFDRARGRLFGGARARVIGGRRSVAELPIPFAGFRGCLRGRRVIWSKR